MGLSALKNGFAWFGSIGAVLLLMLSLPVFASNQLVLGVYAYQSKERVTQQYQAFADYLSRQVEGADIKLSVLNADELQQGVRNGEVDLLLSNPSLFEILRSEEAFSGALATVEMLRGRYATSQLGGVMFRLADQTGAADIHSLAGKQIAIPTWSNTGAYRVPLYEAVLAGVEQQSMQFVLTGNNDSVVEAVLNGQADVGFVRTGILEYWIDQGRLDASAIQIINSKQSKAFPYRLSTRLYPEWPFVVASDVDESVVRQIAVALYSLDASHPAAKQAGIAGFVPPLDYLPLQEMLRDLRLPPYHKTPEFSLLEAIQQHLVGVIIFSMFFLLLLVAFVSSHLLRLKLKRKTQSLDEILLATEAITWEWDLVSSTVVFNDPWPWERVIGYRADELAHTFMDTWWSLAHPADRKVALKKLKSHLQGKSDLYETEMRVRHKDGHWVWILARGRVVEWDKNSQPLRLSGIHTDIDHLKQTQLLLELKTERDQALLKLPIAAETMNEYAFMQYGQELTEELTQSSISFIHLFNEKQAEIEMVAWSKRTIEEYCHIELYDKHYPMQQAGIWANSAREKRPFVVNDYQAYPEKNGMPEGHASLDRMISVPVIEDDRVVMMTGVGNKDTDYTELDVETVQLISNEIWRLVQHKRIQKAIVQQTEKFKGLVNHLGDNYVVFSHSGIKGEVLYISDTVSHVFGLQPDQVVGKSWQTLVNWTVESLRNAQSGIKQLLSKEVEYLELDMAFQHSNGELRFIRISEHAVWDEKGSLVSVDGLVQHMTREHYEQVALQQAASVFEHAQEGILIADAQGKILNVNRGFTDITGYTLDEVKGKDPKLLGSGRQSKAFYKQMWQALNFKGSWSGEIWNRRKSGEVYPQKININVSFSPKGEVEQYVALFSDISIEKEQQKELEFIAHYDPLTKLPNRVLLTDRVTQAIAYSQRHQTSLAVMFLDLDGFKAINDQYGHRSGDAVLEVLAGRFNSSTRQEDTIARMGGDEFVAVFNEVEAGTDLHHLVERFLFDANTPVHFDGQELQVSASIGVVSYKHCDPDISADQLFRKADQAMYRAKMAGKNQVYYFESVADDEQVHDHKQLEMLQKIERAMHEQQLELFYQPKVNMCSGELVSFEALIRWRDPEHGLVPPVAFLPFLENQPLSIELGYWVIESALQQLEKWQQEGQVFSVSVNVDGELIEQVDFGQRLQALLERYSTIDPGLLTLELLESSALNDINHVSEVINSIRSMGVRFAIDDFGTGYASLNYLKQLPVNELKVDQEFVKDIFEQPQGIAIMEGVLSMARAFNLKVVAEGVESPQHIDVLLKLGVELMQGYAIARPMPNSEVLPWLSSWEWDEAYSQVGKLDPQAISALVAVMEHQRWFAKIERYLAGETGTVPDIVSQYNCGFGRWLYNQAQAEMKSAELFTKLEALHLELHNVGKKAVQLMEIGEEEMAQEQLHKLSALKTELIDLIESMELV